MLSGFFQDLTSYSFLLTAFWASLSMGVLCGLLSPVIVSRKIDYISDGAAHATFAGVAFAFFAGISPLPVAAAAAVLFAFTVSFFSKKKKATENNMIGILLPLFMAVGILFISLKKGYVPDIMGFLFGNILLIATEDLYFLIAITVLTFLFILFFFREIQYYAFDEAMAKHFGIPVTFIHYCTLLCVSLSIVACVKVAGVILVNAFLITPAVTARLFSKSFFKMIVYSVLLSLFACFFGLYAGYILDIPPGTAMVFILFLQFLFFYFIQRKT